MGRERHQMISLSSRWLLASDSEKRASLVIEEVRKSFYEGLKSGENTLLNYTLSDSKVNEGEASPDSAPCGTAPAQGRQLFR